MHAATDCVGAEPMQQKPAQQDAPPVVGVIDPDPVARNGLSTLLHGLGIDVSTFDSAESYLLAANGRHVACLIVDLLLPGMSGLELLRRLRSSGNDVPAATIVKPMINSLTPKYWAMVIALSTSHWEPSTSKTRPPIIKAPSRR